VKLRTAEGTHEGVATETFAVGDILYGAAAGGIKDSAAGTAIGIALEAATGVGDIVEFIDFTVISTTAATISIADSGGFTGQTTVEAALQEIYQNSVTTQGFIPIPLVTLREVSSLAVGDIAANGGLLASDTTPILAPINGATNGCQTVAWAASNNDVVMFQTALPPDLDDAADLIIHTRTKSAGTTNAVGFVCTSWFNEADTVQSDTGETNQTTGWLEKIITIDAGDVPVGAQTLTVALTPAAHTTDILYLSAIWIEYKTKILTA
jgi:hypothetical protein